MGGGGAGREGQTAAGSGRGRHLGRFHTKNTWSHGRGARSPRGLGEILEGGTLELRLPSCLCKLSQKLWKCLLYLACYHPCPPCYPELLASTALTAASSFSRKTDDRVLSPHWWALRLHSQLPCCQPCSVGVLMPPSLGAWMMLNQWLSW